MLRGLSQGVVNAVKLTTNATKKVKDGLFKAVGSAGQVLTKKVNIKIPESMGGGIMPIRLNRIQLAGLRNARTLEQWNHIFQNVITEKVIPRLDKRELKNQVRSLLSQPFSSQNVAPSSRHIRESLGKFQKILETTSNATWGKWSEHTYGELLKHIEKILQRNSPNSKYPTPHVGIHSAYMTDPQLKARFNYTKNSSKFGSNHEQLYQLLNALQFAQKMPNGYTWEVAYPCNRLTGYAFNASNPQKKLTMDAIKWVGKGKDIITLFTTKGISKVECKINKQVDNSLTKGIEKIAKHNPNIFHNESNHSKNPSAPTSKGTLTGTTNNHTGGSHITQTGTTNNHTGGSHITQTGTTNNHTGGSHSTLTGTTNNHTGGSHSTLTETTNNHSTTSIITSSHKK